jgi:hypothetical protein
VALRALLIWFGLLALAVANGGFRETVLIPRLGPEVGRVASTIMLCAAVFIATYLTVRWIHPLNRRDAFLIGFAWLALTLVFEFGFGRVRGKPWTELLADYNVLKGRIWVLVLVTTAMAPFLAARARGLLTQDSP